MEQIIKKTQELLGYDFKVKRLIQEMFIRHCITLEKYNYDVYNLIEYKDKRYIYYYNENLNSCLRLLISPSDIEWYWTTKQFAFDLQNQNIINTCFPQLFSPLDNNLESLINFAIFISKKNNFEL